MRAAGVKSAFALPLLLGLGWVALAQVEEANRELLEQTLGQRYRITLVGAKLLGLSGDRNTIQRPGSIVALAREGLSASLNPNLPASYAIRQGQAELVRGDKDVPVPSGERFYVHAIYVGSDVVTLGLVSVRSHSAAAGTKRVWMALNFFFPPTALAESDVAGVYSTLDQWLVREGEAGVASISRRRAANEPPESSPARLKVGMEREQVLQRLGPPAREVRFGERSWLAYGGLVVVLEQGQLISVEGSRQPPAQVSVVSEPEGAEIYIDDAFVGSTPTKLALPPSTYRVDVRHPGYADWQRELRVFAGSEITLRARLEDKP